MAWLESHQSLGDHPKTKKLCRLLRISKREAVGTLHILWWWALDYAEDGDLTKYELMDIAIGADWDGAEGEFVDALVTAGFLDRDANGLRIHDWHDYAGKLIERRERNAQRMRDARAGNEQSTNDERATHVQGTMHARVQLQNQPTIPNQPTEPTLPPEPAAKPKAIKPLPENGPAQQIVAEYCRVAGIDAPAVYRKAVGQAEQMVKAGITAADIPSLYAFAAEWKGTADLGLMLGQVDRWRAKPVPIGDIPHNKGGRMKWVG